MKATVTTETYLARIPVLDGLASGRITNIAHSTRQIRVRKGDILYRKNERCTGFHSLIRGQVKLTVGSPQGIEKVVSILVEGDSFGEETMLSENLHNTAAQALTDCLLLHVCKSAFFAETQRDPRLWRKMLALMASREHQLMIDIESIALHSGRRRIIDFLLNDLSDEDLQGRDIVFSFPASKGAIASRLNLTQEHFSRLLLELSQHRLIVMQGKNVVIPCAASLRRHDV